jgi:FkbM family methyltransferase
MSIPKTIHFTIPEHPTEVQLRNIQIARDLHPDWTVVVWKDPVDRTSFILAKYWDKTNSGAQLADLIRLEVVYQQGGFYVDSDFVLLRSLEALRAYPFVVGTEDGNVLTNAFFGAVAQSPVLAHLIDELDRNEVDWKLPPDFTTGPRFFMRELKWRDDVTVLPRETFYPYLPGERPRPPRLWTYGTHLWVSSWKQRQGPPRPFRRIYRSFRFRVRKFGRWLVTNSRNFLLTLRQRARLHRPEPYSASGVICAQTVHGPKIYLLGEDLSITPEIALHGTYEFYDEMFAKRVIRRGDWAIDVGANVGAFSLLFALAVKQFGRVYCYEPNPLPASLLKKSIVMNWFHDRVDVRQKALGSNAGTCTLRFSRERLGDATLSTKDSTTTFEKSLSLLTDQSEIPVTVATLDADFPVDLPIRLLKIDAEGFDHHVLRGASRLLERNCVDILMLECLQEVYGEAWGELVAELRKIIGYGYETYILTKSAKLQSINFDEILHSDRDRNIILVARHAKTTISELS